MTVVHFYMSDKQYLALDGSSDWGAVGKLPDGELILVRGDDIEDAREKFSDYVRTKLGDECELSEFPPGAETWPA